MVTAANEAMEAAEGTEQGRAGGRGDVVAHNVATRGKEHVPLPQTKPWDGHGDCRLRNYGKCCRGCGRQAKVGDRVQAREPPGARGFFPTNGDS